MTTASASTSTRTRARRSQPLSAQGRTVLRRQETRDLVSVREAASRLGLSASRLAGDLAKKKSRALVEGTSGWLVDLSMLAEAERVAVLPSGVVVIEQGVSL